jgi:hypothetical protein
MIEKLRCFQLFHKTVNLINFDHKFVSQKFITLAHSVKSQISQNLSFFLIFNHKEKVHQNCG